MDETEKALWDVYDILARAGWGGERVPRDRYLNVDDPRDPPAPAPDARPDPPPPAETPPPESEADRCVRVMREVLLSPPGPHDLVVGVAEVERRLREGRG